MESYFYLGKSADFYFGVLREFVQVCVVANWSYAFFGVCSFGCTHFLFLRR